MISEWKKLMNLCIFLYHVDSNDYKKYILHLHSSLPHFDGGTCEFEAIILLYNPHSRGI